MSLKKNINFLVPTILGFTILTTFIVFAQTSSDINYPVEELGNCQNQTECKTYCDDIEHIESCLNFAGKNDLMSQEEIKEAEKVVKALKAGVKSPGNCQNKIECENYCNNSSHMEECLNFAEAAGLISPEELREARQVAKALKVGVKSPGNCNGKKECDTYCSIPSHMEECLKFSEAAGLISPEELEMARKIVPLMAKGESPGGCITKEECESYCAQDAHMEECAAFAQKAGLMSKEELEMFRKTGGKGPGGCKSKKECDVFCNNPANQNTCFDFAVQHDLLPQEEIERMREAIEEVRNVLKTAPQEILDCINSAVGIDTLNKIQEGVILLDLQIGEQIKKCFEQFVPPQNEQLPSHSGNINSPSPGITGPGGCTSIQECEEYCLKPENFAECSKFIEDIQ